MYFEHRISPRYIKSHFCVYLDKERYVAGGDLMVFFFFWSSLNFVVCIFFTMSIHSLHNQKITIFAKEEGMHV